MNTIEDVLKVLKEKVPNRRPVKYARSGNIWYVGTENMMNGGRKLEGVIDNGWFSVEGDIVKSVLPFDFPPNLKFINL